jgi:hypothetical protein
MTDGRQRRDDRQTQQQHQYPLWQDEWQQQYLH